MTTATMQNDAWKARRYTQVLWKIDAVLGSSAGPLSPEARDAYREVRRWLVGPDERPNPGAAIGGPSNVCRG